MRSENEKKKRTLFVFFVTRRQKEFQTSFLFTDVKKRKNDAVGLGEKL